jgi:hypothetical protein
MGDKEFLKKVEDKVKGAAKAVEDFVEEVAAPEVPVVLVPDQDTSTSKPAGSDSKNGNVKQPTRRR